MRKAYITTMQRLCVGEWKIFGAHGQMKEYSLRVE